MGEIRGARPTIRRTGVRWTGKCSSTSFIPKATKSRRITPLQSLGDLLLNARLGATITAEVVPVDDLVPHEAARIRDGEAEVEVPLGPFT